MESRMHEQCGHHGVSEGKVSMFVLKMDDRISLEYHLGYPPFLVPLSVFGLTISPCFVILLLSTRLLEKATALKNIREKQRLEFVDSAYEERWREECDDARELDGKALTVFMAAELSLIHI